MCQLGSACSGLDSSWWCWDQQEETVGKHSQEDGVPPKVSSFYNRCSPWSPSTNQATYKHRSWYAQDQTRGKKGGTQTTVNHTTIFPSNKNDMPLKVASIKNGEPSPYWPMLFSTWNIHPSISGATWCPIATTISRLKSLSERTDQWSVTKLICEMSYW